MILILVLILKCTGFSRCIYYINEGLIKGKGIEGETSYSRQTRVFQSHPITVFFISKLVLNIEKIET